MDKSMRLSSDWGELLTESQQSPRLAKQCPSTFVNFRIPMNTHDIHRCFV
jgi:hypothetical protein